MRLPVMSSLLRVKFAEPGLRDKLLRTADRPLVEGNTWHDNFWGKCSCRKCGLLVQNGGLEQENWLGKLLEVVREELQS